jgi:hypothetical protein
MGGFIHLLLIVAVIVLVIQHFRDDTEAEYPAYAKPLDALRLCLEEIVLYGLCAYSGGHCLRIADAQ